MKFIITKLTLLALLFAVCVSASDSKKESKYNGSYYKAGVLIINVKPQYRQNCTDHSIDVPQLKDALNKISFVSVDKKFPHIQQPKEKFNKHGYKLVDLSLVYQVRFPPMIDIEKAMSVMKASGVVEYAEPHYLHEMKSLPNDPSISSQYMFTRIKADSAWDVFQGDTNIVVGIIDSGTDWDHPDLVGNTKYNYADPIDGSDNDGDGFTDNFRGWDVSENDNDPMVATSLHGSHVSGCAAAMTNNGVGIAAPAFNCKFFAVKSSLDNSSLIDNGYDGLVYAADHGANILNCSWGRSGTASIFEEQTINYCTFNKDALVVAAAGNDGEEIDHYPSSYKYAVSVAATRSNDNVANFSNYGQNVDVCAPGASIFATWYDNTYASMDGTSMAAPIAAGCAALIKARFPSMSALQVGEQLRTTCDNIYNLGVNVFYPGKLGKGRVNLYRAVTDSLSPGVIVDSSSFTDNDDDVFVEGDTIAMKAIFKNLLRPTTNLTCTLITGSTDVTIIQNSFTAGVLNTNDTVSNFALPYSIVVNQGAPLNTLVPLRIILNDGNWTDAFLVNLVVNVDYVNIAINNVGTSITSKSLIGYNQQGQAQGLGFTYKGSPTILYDMGFMVGAAGTQVSDNVRGTTGNNEDFASVTNVVAHEPGTISDFDVNGVFRDDGITSTAPLNIIVRHNAYAWIDPPNDNFVIVQYFIRNAGTSALNNLWAGHFADWDIPQFANNKCSTDNTRRMGYIWSTDSAGLYGGMKVLTNHGSFNHYALDNTPNNGGIEMTDGYTDAEKYQSLSTARANAGTATSTGNDVLSVVSNGPFTISPGDSIEVSFALIAGKDLAELEAAADASQSQYNSLLGLEPIAIANGDFIKSFPNPADREVRFEFSLREKNPTELTIFNLMGEKVKVVVNEPLQAGRYTVITDISDLPAGNYIYQIQSGSFTKSLPMTVVR